MKLLKFSVILVSIFLTNSAVAQFFCPNGVRTIVNELDFDIDIETNEIIFDLSCDPCQFDDENACDIIGCRENCYDYEFENCYRDCDHEFGYVEIAYCKQECLDHFGYNSWNEYQSCFKNCGEELERSRSITRSAYAFNLWWTHGWVASQQGAPDETFISGIRNGFFSKITHSSTEDFENESISYCYQYEVFVEYDDGTCCRYVGAACYQKA